MAKRFTDTQKWDKKWFRKLSLVHKCLWIYICDRCDHAGIWEVDFETAAHYIGQQIDEKEAAIAFEKQFIALDSGLRWIIKDFIIFQYGNYDETNKMFKPIQASLNRYGVSMGDIWGINPLKVTVKDKVKVKETVKDNGKPQESPHKLLLDPSFNTVFNEYLDMRKSIRKPATDRAKQLILKDLEKYGISTAKAMLEQSIKNSWQGVFELKVNPVTVKPRIETKPPEMKIDPKQQEEMARLTRETVANMNKGQGIK